MILNFKDATTADVFHGNSSKASRKLPVALHAIACRKLDWLNAAQSLDDLKSPPGNRLEKLKGDDVGFHSIRINDQWRIIFKWQNGNAADVQIIDYH